MRQTDLPKHIAIIMDGNGRWAQKRGMPRTYGHKAGVETVRKIVKHCNKLGIEVLTLYAFSMENFKRPREEVKTLMNLLHTFIKKDSKMLCENGVRLKVLGNPAMIPKELADEIQEAVAITAHGTGLQLNIAFAYGARDELVRATAKICERCCAGELALEEINEKVIAGNLDTVGQPDPDLIIRTGGERRISNFLLYQAAYAELYFTDAQWPEFDENKLDEALMDYAGRQRRFGGVS